MCQCLVAGLLMLSACGWMHGDAPGSGSQGPPDAEPGDAGSAPAPGDGGDGGLPGDAGVDAPPVEPDPFPRDPRGGEFAWVVSASGAGDPLSVAVDHDGDILVVAAQSAEVTLGSLRVPPPTSPQGLLVLKLTPDGKPIWARSFSGAASIDRTAVATTPRGDVAIGGAYGGPGLTLGDHALTGAGDQDGFVALLDGASGEPRWAASLASAWDDGVNGIAAGADASGADAIYVYGRLGHDANLDGIDVPAGAYLIRHDADGARRWVHSYPNLDPGFDHALELDPQRGPVVLGTFSGDLALGDMALTDGHGDAAVIGFDPDGQARFAREIRAESTTQPHRSLAVGPGGDIHVASDAEFGTTLVDGHALWARGFPQQDLLLRLTPDGRYAAAAAIAGVSLTDARYAAADATGAGYLIASCSGRMLVQPEIACDSINGYDSVIASYGPDNGYRWATAVHRGVADAMVAAPGDRMIVVGRTDGSSSSVDFGGVQVATQRLFIAALAAGPARPPSPLPAPPTIASVRLEGALDNQLPQGGSGTLVIQGTGLDRVTSARLGDVEVHVPPPAGTDAVLRLPVTIPHGQPPGSLGLVLGNAGGAAAASLAVTVTPVVVAASGSSTGRGTFTSPRQLCGPEWVDELYYGDILLIRDGVHTCSRDLLLRAGVTARGETTAHTVVQGSIAAGLGRLGPAAVETMTIAISHGTAINAGWASVTDVDVQTDLSTGIRAGSGSIATVSRFRYQGAGWAILVDGGRVDARQVESSGAIVAPSGTLDLVDSQLTVQGVAIDAGNESAPGVGADVSITGSTLSASAGILAAGSRLTVRDTTIEAQDPASFQSGILMIGGTITLRSDALRGWGNGAILLLSIAGLEDALRMGSVTLDRVEIENSRIGVLYEGALPDARFLMQHSRVSAQQVGLDLSGTYAAADLGTAASPGDNQLAASDNVALSVSGPAGVAVDAHGTLLNGISFQGDVQGPAEVPGGYRIWDPVVVHF